MNWNNDDKIDSFDAHVISRAFILKIENVNPNDSIKVRNEEHLTKSVGKITRVTQLKKERPLPKSFLLPSNFSPFSCLCIGKQKAYGKCMDKVSDKLGQLGNYAQKLSNNTGAKDVVQTAVKKWDCLGTKSICVSLLNRLSC